MLIYNPTLSPKIVKELNYLEEKYFSFDLPVFFCGELYIYPVNIKDYSEFINCSMCLTLNKNDSSEGVLMRHLDYLFTQIQDSVIGEDIRKRLYRLFEIIFQKENGFICQHCGKLITYSEILNFSNSGKNLKEFVCSCGEKDFREAISFQENPTTKKKELYAFGTVIDANNFDRLRQIVMYQNFPDYKDDSWVNLEIRKEQQEAYKLRAKKNGSKSASASLEKKIISVSAATNYKFDEIYKLSIRKFLLLLTTVDDLVNYISDRIAIMSGMVKPTKEFQHWIYKSNTSLYEAAVTADSYTNKINSP